MTLSSCDTHWQVSSNKVARAENASLRSELGGLRSQLSETSKQLEAERATSAALPFPELKILRSRVPSCRFCVQDTESC